MGAGRRGADPGQRLPELFESWTYAKDAFDTWATFTAQRLALPWGVKPGQWRRQAPRNL